jgi:hypothetical protein
VSGQLHAPVVLPPVSTGWAPEAVWPHRGEEKNILPLLEMERRSLGLSARGQRGGLISLWLYKENKVWD